MSSQSFFLGKFKKSFVFKAKQIFLNFFITDGSNRISLKEWDDYQIR